MRVMRDLFAASTLSFGRLCAMASLAIPLGSHQAACATRLSLPEAVAIAVRNNASILSGRISRDVERFDLRIAERKFIPLVGIVGEAQHSRSETLGATSASLGPVIRWSIPTGAELNYAWSGKKSHDDLLPSDQVQSSVSVRQPLLKGAGFRIAGASVQQARWQDEINQLRQRDTMISAVSHVIVAYRTLQKARQARQIALSGVARAERLIDTNKSLVDAGRLPSGDLVQNQADLAAQRVGLAQAEVSESNAQRLLAQLLSVERPDEIEASDDVVPRAIALPTIDDAMTIAEQNQPAYQQARLLVEQARLEEDVAANERLPDVALVVSRSRNNSLPDTARTLTTTGLQWTIPLNDLSMDRPLVQARAQRAQSELNLREVRTRTSQGIRQVLQSLAVLGQQVDLASKQVDLTKMKLDLELEKLNVGRTTNFQVLSFEADLRQAELGRLDAVLNYQNGVTELDQVLGTALATWGISVNE